MTHIVIDYAPRSLQREIHKGLKRWNLIVCHRRFGKTVMAVNELIKRALIAEQPNTRLAYLAPLYRQAKAVAWDYLKHFSRPVPGIKINESELRVDYPNGSRIQLFGCDSPDTLRGIYLDFVVLDEYAQMPASLFGEVIRPALADRKGGAMFIGTPKGMNAFYELYEQVKDNPEWLVKVYKASETQVIPNEELREARTVMDPDEFEQEFECSWTAAIQGAYYARQLAALREQGRITSVPHEPSIPVHTVWDLGVGDSTAIWFAQMVGTEIRLIDYYEMTGEGLPHFAKHLQTLPYVYGEHYAPHDIRVRELGSGKSRIEIAASLGIEFNISPNVPVDDGIEAVRATLPKCWFDAEKCRRGNDARQDYGKDWNDKLGSFRVRPRHDWSSHAADAFRYLALSLKPDAPVFNPEREHRYTVGGWMA